MTARSLLVAVAATALVVMLCGAASLSLARQMQLPILGFSPTATAGPTVTPLPTATPSPTPQPTATATLRPTVRLTLGAFTWKPYNGTSSCTFIGQSQVSNPAGNRTLGWHWDNIAPQNPPSFRWGFTDKPSGFGNLPVKDALEAGQGVTLYIQANKCNAPGHVYTVTMLDSVPRTYTFTFTLPS